MFSVATFYCPPNCKRQTNNLRQVRYRRSNESSRKVRRHWPEVRILVRGDSGFCREEMMGWCESHNVSYLFGLARNKRLEAMLLPVMSEAKKRFDATGTASRVFSEINYETLDSWSLQRRVVGKAEYLEKGPNPRFVVTNLSQEEYDARTLYEDIYCARGEMENRIKGAAAGTVRRSNIDTPLEIKSDASVVVECRLCSDE
jgi:hypothetical protein